MDLGAFIHTQEGWARVQARRIRPRQFILLAAMLLTAVAVPVAASDRAPTTQPLHNARIEQSGDVATVTFDSVVLARRTTVLVWLPDGYRATGTPWPAAYFLHGELQQGASPRAQVENLALGALGAKRRFLLVAPDMDDTAACMTCLWTDGRSGLGVAAERHLLDEVVPLIESEFNVRSGRGGRAVLGTSMGGTGALVQGFRHPDLFGFVGALSPVLDLVGAARDVGARYDAYLTTQGFRPRGVGEIDRRNVSPLELAPQVVATNVDVVIAALAEERSANDPAAAVLTELGLPHTFFTHDGPRFGSDGSVFAAHVLDAMLHVFDDPMPEPEIFSYKSADPTFGIFDYWFAAERSNTEFLSVLGARKNGTEFTLAGTGKVAVTTPGSFKPGRDYRVIETPDPRREEQQGAQIPPYRPRESVVQAGPDGALTFTVELRPTRLVDEQKALVHGYGSWPVQPATGLFEHPHVRVDIAPAKAGDADTDSTATPDEAWLWRECTATACDLPAPYNAWNVRVYPWADNPQVLTLDFNSSVLGLRARNYVHLPDSYLTDSRRFPVLYFLHGSIPDGDFPTRSGKWTSWNMRFQEKRLLARQQYLVVSADMNELSWCTNCWWLNALDPPAWKRTPNPTTPCWPPAHSPLPSPVICRPTNAENHLYEELIPLIEAMFRVRTDRGGRGNIGNSMGASGSTHHAFRHPDRWGFSGGLAGAYDLEYFDPSGMGTMRVYPGSQGYPFLPAGQALYRNISPADLSGQVLGTDLDVLISVGDDCVNPDLEACPHPDAVEPLLRRDNEHTSELWAQIGVPHSFATFHGNHWLPDGAVYETLYVDAINRRFSKSTVDPFRFSYKTVDRTVSVWGYDFAVRRANDEFFSVLGARLDGRSFTVAGTGAVTVTSPGAFTPGREYAVRIAPAGDESSVRTLIADSAGRLVIDVQLAAERTIDERRELVEAGQFAFPQTQVEVLQP